MSLLDLLAAPAHLSSLVSPGGGMGMMGMMGMAGFNISQSCQSTIVNLITPDLATCLDLPALLPLIQTDESIIPPLNDYLTSYCATPTCSNQTLLDLAGNLTEGCAPDFEEWGIPSSAVYQIVPLYPVVRDVMCLKTTEPESANFDNATIPIESYGAESGTWCLTDLATQVSAYWGGNLTWSSLVFNAIAETYNRRIPDGILCQDCIYGALAIVEEAYPGVADAQWSLGGQTFSIDGYLEETCAADGFDGTPEDGSLPETIERGASEATSSESPSKRMVWIARDVDRL